MSLLSSFLPLDSLVGSRKLVAPVCPFSTTEPPNSFPSCSVWWVPHKTCSTPKSVPFSTSHHLECQDPDSESHGQPGSARRKHARTLPQALQREGFEVRTDPIRIFAMDGLGAGHGSEAKNGYVGMCLGGFSSIENQPQKKGPVCPKWRDPQNDGIPYFLLKPLDKDTLKKAPTHTHRHTDTDISPPPSVVFGRFKHHILMMFWMSFLFTG